MPSASSRAVFISYAHEDQSDVHDVAELIRASGADIFLDVSNIDYGCTWEDALFAALDRSDRILVFWSQAAARSEWVDREWRYALAIGKIVVPLPLDSEPLPPELARIQSYTRLPRLLRKSQTIAASRNVANPETVPVNDAIRDIAVYFVSILQTDYVVIATCQDATEAHILKSLLRTKGLEAVLADANYVQAYSPGSVGVGWVKLRIPAPLESEARLVLEDFRNGVFDLGAQNLPPPGPEYVIAPHPLFSPDAAAAWSIALSPVFAAALNVKNRYLESRKSASAWAWVGISIIMTAPCFFVLLCHPLLYWVIAWPLSTAWYLSVGYADSIRLTRIYGPNYPKRPIRRIGLISMLTIGAVLWAIDLTTNQAFCE